MKVEVLRSTNRPERLVCQAGRGDYHEGYVGDTEYRELMKGVTVEDYHYDGLSHGGPLVEGMDEREVLKPHAQTRSFIETQLSRGHYGLWEHPQITFTVKGVSRVTMAQITRHRHLSFDVQSMRYADFAEQEITVPATLLSDAQRHEQYPHIYDENGEHFNRDEGHFEMSEEKRQHWKNAFVNYKEQMRGFYQDMVAAGIPKEDARFILPLGTTVNMTISGNARTFLHLLDMRRKQNAQWEIRELSELLLEELFDWMPWTYEYYADHGPNKLSP